MKRKKEVATVGYEMLVIILIYLYLYLYMYIYDFCFYFYFLVFWKGLSILSAEKSMQLKKVRS